MIKLLEKIQLTIGGLFLATFFITVIIQVITRLIGVTAMWTGEASKYAFIWSVFMGASVMLNRREHFNFDMLLNKLQGKARSTLVLINDLILFLFTLAILIFGIQATQSFWDYTWVSVPAIKMGYVWIAVPIMGGTMAIYTLSHIVNTLKNFGRKEAAE